MKLVDNKDELSALTESDRIWVRKLTNEAWSGETVVAHGVIYFPDQLPGFMLRKAGIIQGFITYTIDHEACEIVTILSLASGKGIGTTLIRAVENRARELGCLQIWLITTNDNLSAIRFYQKRGFRLTAVFPDAVTASRLLKPSIPLIGEDGIPIRDELKFEKAL